MIQVTVTMGRSVWYALISYAVDLVKKLGEVVAQSDQTSKVQEMLLEGIAKRHNPEYRKDKRVRDGAEQSTRMMLITMLAYVRAQKRNDSRSRLIRSFLMQHFTKDQLDCVQDQAGIPQEERVLYGADAWARGRKDYSNMLLSGNSNMVDLKELTSSRVSDQVVMEVVGCVVENCDIKSWGENLVPLGGGESIAMPSLTPKCGLEEMWEQYSQSKDEERVQFISIFRHDGPLALGHKTFKGSAYNLLILWADGFNSSWEPLFALQLDDPVTRTLYGKANNLLDAKGWMRLKKYLKEDGTANGEATLMAFKGSQNSIVRTAFLELAHDLVGIVRKNLKCHGMTNMLSDANPATTFLTGI
jgi:hypothetical protein